MIYQIIFANLPPEKVNVSVFGEPPKMVDAWGIIRNNLETTQDHIVWIITVDQLSSWMDTVRRKELGKYLVIDHSKEGQGTTNRNYPDRKLRLKVFVMKGVGNHG